MTASFVVVGFARPNCAANPYVDSGLDQRACAKRVGKNVPLATD
jgi:hypothetical protein